MIFAAARNPVRLPIAWLRRAAWDPESPGPTLRLAVAARDYDPRDHRDYSE